MFGNKNKAGNPDPHALAAATFAQQFAGPDTVILFGSRATGGHRPESDMDSLLSNPRESTTLAAELLSELMEYTSYTEREGPAGSFNWPNKYAVTYRYGDTEYRMSPADQVRFVTLISRAAFAFVERAHQLTGTASADPEV